MSCSLTLKVVAGAGGDPPKTPGDSTDAAVGVGVEAVAAPAWEVGLVDAACDADGVPSVVEAGGAAAWSETTSFPTMPASACPGTVHSYWYSPVGPVLNVT